MSATVVAWIYLISAGILESLWAMGIKISDGFTKPLPTIITLILVVSSFFLLSKAMKVLPVGVSYAVWCAIGIVGVVIIEYLYFNSSINMQKVFAIVLILLGITILKIS